MTPEARAWKVLLTEYEDREQAVHIFAEQIRAAIAEEREGCAAFLETTPVFYEKDISMETLLILERMIREILKTEAAAIRARGGE